MGRWVQVLSAFIDRSEWGVRELATEVGMPKSASHRILHEMDRLGLLSKTDQPGHFRLGPEMARLAVLLAERIDVRTVARPILEQAAEEIGETVILALYSPLRRQFWAVEAVEAKHTISYIWGALRTWSDLHVGSSGKGILAFLPPLEQAEIIDALPEPVGLLRPISKAALRKELEEARRRGYVVSRGERFAGAIGVAAPIRDATGRVVGDIISSWPDNRTSHAKEQAAGEAVARVAAAVSAGMGYVRERPGR